MSELGGPERDGKQDGGEGANPWAGGDSEAAGPGGGAPADEPRNPWQGRTVERQPRRAAGIDDIFRQRSRRGGGGGPASRRADMAKWLLPLGSALVLGALAASSFHVLGEGEQGLVTTLGRYEGTVGPGLSVTLPWPVQHVEVRDTGKIAQLAFPETGGETLLLTRDQFLVNLAWQLRWKVKDLRAYSYGVDDPQGALRRLASAQMRAAVAETPFDAVWDGTGQAQLQDRVRRRLQAVLDAYGMGVSVEGVEVTRADPPGRLAAAFQRVTEVREAARKDQNTARNYAQQTLANARSEADEFNKAYAEYKVSPEVYRRRVYYESMEKVLGNNQKVVVDAGTSVVLPAPAAKAPAPAAPAAPAEPAGATK